MKIKTVIIVPSETYSLQHQRNTERSEKSTKTKITPKQAMIKKKPENKQKVEIITSRKEAASGREEERERGKKYQERPQARRDISQWMSPEHQHSASKI